MLRIVSGGQTGVDRGALDAALDAGVPCGGWCPAGRLAEDGAIAEKYPLQELPGGDYAARTLKNVQDSDATLILNAGDLEGGTALTQIFCEQEDKPCLVIDAVVIGTAEAAERAAAFVAEHGVETLNVAGPRASKWAGAYDYAYAAISEFLQCHCER